MITTIKTIKRIYRVDRRQINFIRFVFEAYEGVAVVTTLDPSAGLISLAIAPGCEAVAEAVVADLSKSVLIQPAEAAMTRRKEESA